MNDISKTIKYAQRSCNPWSGCWGPAGTATKPNHCPYCFARRIAERFRGTKAWPNGFDPTPRLDRLGELGGLRKPVKVFMGDAGDLFGGWVPSLDIQLILQFVRDFGQHTYLFLTKNPQRLPEFNPWPDNCFVGVSATTNEQFEMAIRYLKQVEAKVKFISFEPLLGRINLDL